MNTAFDVKNMYLDLLRNYLTKYGEDEIVPVFTANHPIVKRIFRLMANRNIGLVRAANNPIARRVFGRMANRNIRLVRTVPFDEDKRNKGLDWPASADTMIGMQRLTHLQRCVEDVLAEDIPGDLVECGVWRGGACILMRAVLAAYGDKERTVWVADSFQGVPPPSPGQYPADSGLYFNLASGILAVPESRVRNNFRRYGLLDDRVRFLAGWFKDTLPSAPIDRIALLRLDGDLYESTIQALDALYPRLSPGGFCIIDDYHPIDACRQAVTDYRQRNSISAEIVDIDGSGVYWRKPRL